MIRTRVQFTEEEFRQLRAAAAARNTSVTALIRESIQLLLQNSSMRSDEAVADERRRRAIAAVGRFRSGYSDLSAAHDQHLSETYAR